MTIEDIHSDSPVYQYLCHYLLYAEHIPVASQLRIYDVPVEHMFTLVLPMGCGW